MPLPPPFPFSALLACPCARLSQTLAGCAKSSVPRRHPSHYMYSSQRSLFVVFPRSSATTPRCKFPHDLATASPLLSPSVPSARIAAHDAPQALTGVAARSDPTPGLRTRQTSLRFASTFPASVSRTAVPSLDKQG